MAKRSLIITSNEAVTGKKLQKAISDINPQASANTMKQFARKLNALTTNTYIQADCIDKFTVDTETAAEPKKKPTVTIANDNWLTATSGGTNSSVIETDSDGEISVAVNGARSVAYGILGGNGQINLMGIALGEKKAQSEGTVTVRISETDTFEAYEQTFNFTIA